MVSSNSLLPERVLIAPVVANGIREFWSLFTGITGLLGGIGGGLPLTTLPLKLADRIVAVPITDLAIPVAIKEKKPSLEFL